MSEIVFDEVTKVLRVPDMKDLILTQGAEVVDSSPEEFAAFMKSESAKWARVI